ncbi:MAG: glycosyltransferase [Oscillospiraceae bacterium]|nr:glycosyltransferase [Oscillospiraceae bacterium]
MKPVISVIIPAHNEECYIRRCIASIRRAAKQYPGRTEIIVVCNRCTDKTEEIARRCGAVTVQDSSRCIAKVRNAGIAAATGQIIVTIDCDNRMTPGTLSEIYRLLRSGRYIGGGAPIRFERYSLPLYLNDYLCRIGFRLTGLYCGIFWAKRSTFDAIGGFADIRAMEDVETAKRLKTYGKQQGRGYTCLRENYLINSTRKFDRDGDWMYFKLLAQHTGTFAKAALGDGTALDQLLDALFYEYPHDTAAKSVQSSATRPKRS